MTQSYLFTNLDLTRSAYYPPSNIYKDGEDYVVELAVAGFKKEELEVYVKENNLIISGSKSEDAKEPTTYIHRGISTKKFLKSYELNSYAVIREATYVDGLLSIRVGYDLPEEKRRKVIEIQ